MRAQIVTSFFALLFSGAGLVMCQAPDAPPPKPGVIGKPDNSPKTDFSGRWRMVKEQSDFGAFHMPDIVVRMVDDHDPTLNVHTVQTAGDKTTVSDVLYLTDGSIAKNVINGRDAESKAFWDGPVLVIRTSMKNSKGDDELIEDRWDLSADKQTLTTTSHVNTTKGQVDMKMVCAREKAGS